MDRTPPLKASKSVTLPQKPAFLVFKKYIKTVADPSTMLSQFESFCSSLDARYSRILGPVLEMQAKAFDISPNDAIPNIAELQKASILNPRTAIRAEIFRVGNSIATLSISLRNAGIEGATRGILQATTIASNVEDDPALKEYVAKVNSHFSISLSPSPMLSERAQRLKRDGGFTCATAPAPDELGAARVLADRASRSLAQTIKSGSGLLVADVEKSVAANDQPNIGRMQKTLLDCGVVSAETVVICTKSGRPSLRLASKSDVRFLSERDVRCSCGKRISEERVEEALTITPLGASLLDKSRWMTVSLVDELSNLGVDISCVYIEQQIGGDELDCIALISGDVVLFELKDGEFSLGHAYSFNSKVGLVRPDLSVIWTTDKVGGDARDHFERRQQVERESARPRYGQRESVHTPTYIEGVPNLGKDLAIVATVLAARDARQTLSELLPLAAASPTAILQGWIRNNDLPGQVAPQ